MDKKFQIFVFSLCLILVACTERKSNCINNSENWCKTVEIAKECNVLEQCFKYVWSVGPIEEIELDAKVEMKQGANDLVNFTLYYETLCPDCRDQLSKAVKSVSSIMNLTLVPYGNAKETWRNETKLWQFTCQHGSDECWGNLFHSCLIHYHYQAEDVPVILCMESDDKDDIKTAAKLCTKQYGVDIDPINKCMNSVLGNSLQHENAVKTEQLNPPHKYVPWVTVNGIHTEEIQTQAQNDLVGLICTSYKGPSKPAAC